MALSDDAVEVRAQGWRRLAALHGFIETSLEKELQASHQISVVEFTVLDALSRQQDGWHLRMQQVARAAALSSSATTRPRCTSTPWRATANARSTSPIGRATGLTTIAPRWLSAATSKATPAAWARRGGVTPTLCTRSCRAP